jgi:hypothetical protein
VNSVVVFHCEDWVAAYLNGNLFGEGHSLLPDDWMTLGQKVGMEGKIDRFWLTEKQVEDELNCTFPRKLSDIPSNIYQNTL